jgi:predicted DNA-binding protein
MMPRTGRPPLPPDKRKSHIFGLRLEESELKRIRAIAKRLKMKPAALIREYIEMGVEMDETDPGWRDP